MLKTTVYLEESVAVELRDLSEVTDRSQAELIREAIRRYVAAEARKVKRPAPIGLGEFRSGQRDVGHRAEELLRTAARRPRRKR